jgi:HAMP domain-containing protein
MELEQFLSQAPQFSSPSLKRKPAAELTKAGWVGLDGRFLNFAPQCRGWHELTSKGGSGSFLIFWTGLWKLTTAATIPYYTGRYADSPRGFGYVTIGADVNEFHAAATESSEQLQKLAEGYVNMVDRENSLAQQEIDYSLASTAQSLSFSTLVMAAFVIAVAIWMAAVLTRRITAIISGIRLFQSGQMDHRLEANSNDEMGDLARSFNEMADELQSSIRRVVESELREKTKGRCPHRLHAGLFDWRAPTSQHRELTGRITEAAQIRRVLNQALSIMSLQDAERGYESVAGGGKDDRTPNAGPLEEIL